MTLVQKDEKEHYTVPAPLVHKLIIAIFTSLIAIGGYMAIWAVNDAAFKSEIRTVLKTQAEQTKRMNDILLQHLDGHPARVEDQVEAIERRIERLEDEQHGVK